MEFSLHAGLREGKFSASSSSKFGCNLGNPLGVLLPVICDVHLLPDEIDQ